MIDLAIITWPNSPDRLNYLMLSLESIRENVRATRQTLSYVVSAETADVTPENRLMCERICEKYGCRLVWHAAPASLGGNMNHALLACNGDYILLTQDDWTFLRPVDLSPDVEFLAINREYALVRYAAYYTQFTGLIRPDLQDVNMHGPYPYGDQPHLRRAPFAHEFGWYRESLSGDYSTPENDLSGRLTERGWKIAAHVPNVCEHHGVLSTSPARRAQSRSLALQQQQAAP